ncbi:uncharacterized protein BCR38DRAFT_520613 [Pseudomassariella vexata]|uniref:DUF6594 domain-containing protein n=1 Tax=Pseudomassariella vexata TaxID=1141098 RepID=A0A1Y2EDP8_9PEZI|nr:uncharacterized protein BCR38DRAFT_520613 [Pseudomassariella vexata]ORY69692.1 hypothetical protein BCR38DRAFT_520613 [Pseudomassariella vexata]
MDQPNPKAAAVEEGASRATNWERGYPYLAQFWTKTQTGMARKFNHLAVLNILFLQAELCHLEYEFARQRKKDLESGEKRRVDCDWNWLLLSEPELNRGSGQWESFLEIRKKLGEYYSAVLQYQQINSLRQPSDEQREDVFNILGDSTLNDSFGHFQSLDLAGIDGPMVYGSQHGKDLVLLDAREDDNDALFRYIVRPMFWFVHYFWKAKKKPMTKDLESGAEGEGEKMTRLYHYMPHQFEVANRVVGALTGASLPVVSMVILYKFGDMNTKVALVCVFTIIFCLLLSIMSKARRIEVFAATAAFASVQVVWISQSNDHM